MPSRSILAIVGPTATGKSDLAVVLARKFNGEIISADSRQVYRGLNIGTGKITRREMCSVRHHLLDVADPRRRFTVERYRKLAEAAITDIRARGKLPILCGGTGFYIQAVIDGASLPDVPPNPRLRARLSHKSADELFAMLSRADAQRASDLKRTSDWKNPRRLIRALEIVAALGKVPPRVSTPRHAVVMIGLSTSLPELRARIRDRLQKRLHLGMIAEAKRLHASGLSWKRMDELGLEYRYLGEYLQGALNAERKQAMLEKLAIEIGRYAKRQLTWFRRDNRIHWFKPGDQNGPIKLVSEIVDKIQ